MSECRICTRCVLPESFPGISFDEEGVCSVCREHQSRWSGWDEALPEKRRILDQLCADARNRKKVFDVLIPLSGGKDSMYVLYRAAKELQLKCLAYTLDNGYLTDHARSNIDRACRILGVEHVYYCMDPVFINRLFATFMRQTGYFCSVCMRAIGMATERIADMYDVPLVFSGSSPRTELPLSREMFQPGPVSYIKNVMKVNADAEDAGRLLYNGSLKRRTGYRLFWWGSQKHLRSYAWINLPDYLDWDYNTMSRIIKEELGWQVPEGEWEHTDCSIHPITTYLHNRRFPGLEVQRLTMARLIQAGQMSREEALQKLAMGNDPEPSQSVMNGFLKNIQMTRREFDGCIDKGPRHLQFRSAPGYLWRVASRTKKMLFHVLRIRR